MGSIRTLFGEDIVLNKLANFIKPRLLTAPSFFDFIKCENTIFHFKLLFNVLQTLILRLENIKDTRT